MAQVSIILLAQGQYDLLHPTKVVGELVQFNFHG